MTTDQLHKAHQRGYARQRAVLLVSGDVQPAVLLDEVARATECLPDAPISVRRQPYQYGGLPAWQGGQLTRVPQRHEDAMVYLLFPIPSLDQAGDQFARWEMLDYLITAGDLGSPLNRIVREQSHLAYSPEFTTTVYPDGGYWGLAAQTSESPERVLDTFWQVLRSEELRSSAWYDFVIDGIRGEVAMHDPCPDDFTEAAAERLVGHGEAWSDREYERRMLAISRDDMVDFLDCVTPDDAHALVFESGG